jgi:hypothetical protein
MRDARDGMAAVDGAGIAVVDRRWGARYATSRSVARRNAIAHVVVGVARSSCCEGNVPRSAGLRANVGGTGVAVVVVERNLGGDANSMEAGCPEPER